MWPWSWRISKILDVAAHYVFSNGNENLYLNFVSLWCNVKKEYSSWKVYCMIWKILIILSGLWIILKKCWILTIIVAVAPQPSLIVKTTYDILFNIHRLDEYQPYDINTYSVLSTDCISLYLYVFMVGGLAIWLRWVFCPASMYQFDLPLFHTQFVPVLYMFCFL